MAASKKVKRAPEISNALDTFLHQFIVRMSDDPVKADRELYCQKCNTHLCDVQDGDTMDVLVSVTRHHHHKCK